MAHTEIFETINGCKTRILRGGRGAPLLFLHGANGARQWLPFMDVLAEDYDVIVPEHPGYGASETPEWLDNVGDLAYFYFDLFDHFGLEGVNLVGTSLGGWIAAEMAVRNDAGLNRLVLVAPAGIHVKGVRKTDSFMLSPEAQIEHLFHDPGLVEKAKSHTPSEDEQMMIMKNRLTTAKLGWQPRMYNPHLYKWLHRIGTPTLIIWGENDRLLPPAYGPAYRDLIPGARLETIADCGHLPHVEQTDAYVGLIRGFIEQA